MVRPIGIKKAKKGKGTSDEVALEVKEHLQTQATQKKELEGIKDLQQKLSHQRVEDATLQLKAAQEKEAKWSSAPCGAGAVLGCCGGCSGLQPYWDCWLLVEFWVAAVLGAQNVLGGDLLD
ncbi:hypothetical protein E2562_021171 [Oryza meyeriana var. granulata]|uniref:Uncharacterized protein n=1 Tax=Oryza meyeriana var. granulata TaxID=110450 RepID=A0A6G1DZK5_9ORYZ|nr:hypothetical protein E2562_021171 [Oryza meyeriana var. granulata]